MISASAGWGVDVHYPVLPGLEPRVLRHDHSAVTRLCSWTWPTMSSWGPGLAFPQPPPGPPLAPRPSPGQRPIMKGPLWVLVSVDTGRELKSVRSMVIVSLKPISADK